MSALATRVEIAARASEVDGVAVAPYYEMSTTAGDGGVRYGRTDYPNRLGGVVTWQVVVNLPQSFADAERMADDLIPQLVEKLGEHPPAMIVRSASLANVVYDTGQQLPSLIIEGTRESE